MLLIPHGYDLGALQILKVSFLRIYATKMEKNACLVAYFLLYSTLFTLIVTNFCYQNQNFAPFGSTTLTEKGAFAL